MHDYARREQHRFFRGERYDPFEAASMIALEAMLIGAEDVRVRVIDGWICVFSDLDWLAGIEPDVFSGFAPFKPGGPNSVTSDFLPVVFSRAVVMATRGDVRIVKGDSAGPLAIPGDSWIRALAFEIASE